MEYAIMQYGQLDEKQKREAAEIFADGFGHLMKFTKDREILKALIFQALHPLYMYALVEEGTVLGILGVATNRIRPVKLKPAVCKELFGGLKGAVICKQGNAIFQSQIVRGDTDLYIDTLATAKHARGRGVATKLLQHSFELPGYEYYYIDVLSKNVNARRLYEKLGFVEYKKERFSPLAFQGYGYPVKMKRR